MRVTVDPKPAERLLPTGLLHQTAFWGRVKSRLGWEAMAFDIEAPSVAVASLPPEREPPASDLLIVLRTIGTGASMAYAPFGPELLPDDEARGLYLERLSEELRPRLPSDCLFIRYELPWESPYAREADRFDEEGQWLGAPEPRLRELRMNWGTKRRNLRVAPSDTMAPDTLILDLRPSEPELLAAMHPSTRRNLRLAERNGVELREGGIADLDAWYKLYRETAQRQGFRNHRPEHFAAVLAEGEREAGKVGLLLAEQGGRMLAGLFLVHSGWRSTFLYGASTALARELRASYALQWGAIRKAKAAGSLEYDFFGCSPRPDPAHPLYGLWRFKSGFGGRLVHRQGAWDFPLWATPYEAYRAKESAGGSFHHPTSRVPQ